VTGSLGRVPVPLLLAVTVFFWGAAFNVTDIALEYTSVGITAISRPLIAALILLPLLPLLGGRLPRSPRVWLYAALVGLGATTLALTGLGIGAQTAGPAVTAVLINSAPFFAVLMARAVLDERVKLLRGMGLVVGFIGVVVIVLSNPGEAGSSTALAIGIAAVIVGAVGHAGASVLVRWMSVAKVETELWGFTTAQFICGTVLTIPVVFLVGDASATDWSAPTLWWSLAFLGIGSQLIAFAFFFIALSRWTSGRVMAWSFLPPVVAAVIEIVRGNVPGTLTLVGMAIAVIGVAIVNHPRAEDTPVPTIDPEEHVT